MVKMRTFLQVPAGWRGSWQDPVQFYLTHALSALPGENGPCKGVSRRLGKTGLAPETKANFHVPARIFGGVPEMARVGRHPWLALFGRAYPYRGMIWKPDLLNKIGDFFLGDVFCGVGETGPA
ncbi:MAG: hypothetical protein VB089_21205 [Anaerolineaceae bacterium]|nr:hypothetical protein [Anaerolineaceae bacterium]